MTVLEQIIEFSVPAKTNNGQISVIEITDTQINKTYLENPTIFRVNFINDNHLNYLHK